MNAYATLRFAAAVYYVGMCLWLVAAGIHRFLTMIEGIAPVDPAPITSVSLGVVGLLLGAAILIVRAVKTRHRTHDRT